jgi:hypothetical protein
VRTALALAAAALLLAGCGGPLDSLPNIDLPTLAGPDASLRQCATSKCVVAYVAPWCPHCRSNTPGILALRDAMWKKGVLVRVVVGMDKPENLRAYAQVFGPNTLLDPNNRFSVNGVPHFYVADAGGRIKSDFAGTPRDGATADELASAFGLP